MKKALALLLLCCLLLGGCVSRQLEEELLVIVLAVDENEAGEVTLTVKVPASAAHNRDGQDGYLLYAARGAGFADALSMLRASVPRQLNFSQVREVVFGLTAAEREDFPLLLSRIDAIPRFRCSAALMVCRGEAGAFAAAQKPDLGIRLSRYADSTLADAAGKGLTPSADLCGALRDIRGGLEDPLLILGALTEGDGMSAPDPNNALDALPGELPRQGPGNIEIFGAAATDGVRVSGFLTGYETALTHLVQGRADALTLRTENGGDAHVAALSPARLEVDLDRRPVLLRLDVFCQAQYAPGSAPDPEALGRRLEDDLLSLVRHLQTLRCDGLGFGGATARGFLTLPAWDAVNWRDVYPEAETEIRVHLQLREK